MKPLLLALLLAAACKHSTSSSSTSRTETSTVTDSTSSESGAQTTVTTQTEGPSKTVTVVEEYAPPTENEPSRGTSALAQQAERGQSKPEVAGSSPAGGPLPRPSHGPLTRRTVTTTEHGPESTQTRQEATSQATGATETKAAGKSDVQAQAQTASAPSGGCVGASWIWGLAVLVGVVGIVYFALKLRKPI